MTPPPAPRASAARSILQRAGVLPVLTVETVEQGLATAQALARGGLEVIEVTLRSEVALEAIARIKRERPGLCIGAGTVLGADQAHAARAAGADFLVTPGTPPALADFLAAFDVPSVPGAASPTEIIALLQRGFDAQKLFPAVAVGGVALLRSIAGPLPGVAFCPTGGIDEANAPQFLALANVACVGGSWMVAAADIRAARFDLIEDAARRARALVDRLRAQ